MIKKVSKESIFDAMKQFDDRYRDSEEWTNWMDNRAHKYAISNDGRLYPVKQIISMATGQGLSSFSGGDESNGYLIRKGFEIVDIDSEDVVRPKGGGDSELRVRSWSRSADIPNLIGRKEVDWSTFTYGSQIPVKFQRFFEEANDGYVLGKGESRDVGLLFEGQVFNAKLSNVDRGVETDTLVIEWRDKGFKELLAAYLSTSYRFIENERKLKAEPGGRSGSVTIPDSKTEYIDFLRTDTPFTYSINLINADVENEDNIEIEIKNPEMLSLLIKHITSRGFIFEPWQIATYVTALRTKPFVILAGVSGTGKSKLPALISGGTGGDCRLIPVRPDWTDSTDVLGYSDLQGKFKPGALLSIAREATENPGKHFVCIMDEMNLARVEHYFAEVLSQLENRRRDDVGNYFSGPLICHDLGEEDAKWAEQVLPPNLAIVGTVNMDESTYGFSRKVLDRAFTIELSEIHLEQWGERLDEGFRIDKWPAKFWFPRAINLNGLTDVSSKDKEKIDKIIEVLLEVNTILIQAQLQVGYRVRDEVALFVLHADEVLDSFVTRNGVQVDPLDLALQMKILPRIIGGNTLIRRVVLQLLGWSVRGVTRISEEDAEKIIAEWNRNGRLTFLDDAVYPRTAARLCLMWERLINEGFTSFWM